MIMLPNNQMCQGFSMLGCVFMLLKIVTSFILYYTFQQTMVS